jgi:hypothetical protein
MDEDKMAKWYNIWNAKLMQWPSFVEWIHDLEKESMSYRTALETDADMDKKMIAGKKRTAVTKVYFESPGGDEGNHGHVASLLTINLDGTVLVWVNQVLNVTNDPHDVGSQTWDNLVDDMLREAKQAEKERDKDMRSRVILRLRAFPLPLPQRSKESNKASTKRSPQREYNAPMINVVLWDDVDDKGNKIDITKVTHAYVGKRAVKEHERFTTVKINGKWMGYSSSSGESLYDAGKKVPQGFKKVTLAEANKKIPTYG